MIRADMNSTHLAQQAAADFRETAPPCRSTGESQRDASATKVQQVLLGAVVSDRCQCEEQSGYEPSRHGQAARAVPRVGTFFQRNADWRNAEVRQQHAWQLRT